MKRAPLIVCVVSALGAAGAGHFYLRHLEAEISGGPKVALVVANEDLPLGAPLTEQKLALRDVPQAYVDPRQVRASDAKRILGVRVSTALKANDPVLWSDVSQAAGNARMLSGLVERGMRAVSVEGRSSDFNGLLRPGDRVDVLFTEGEKGQGGTTVTLLQNLLVLSVGANIAAVDETTRRNLGGGSVTLGASVEGAQILTHAKERGRLSLTLRNADDIAVAEHLTETTQKELNRAMLAAQGPELAKAKP